MQLQSVMRGACVSQLEGMCQHRRDLVESSEQGAVTAIDGNDIETKGRTGSVLGLALCLQVHTTESVSRVGVHRKISIVRT